MDEDKKWEFDAPQHYCDLPSAVTDDDSELADQYFFAKADDTVYFEPNDNETFQEFHKKEEPKEQFPVIRRRSLSVGSKPLQSTSVYEVTAGNSSRKPPPPKATRNKSDDNPGQNFVEGLRAYNTAKATVYEAPRVTKPVPFNLTMPKKKVAKTFSENPSMAEGVHKWEKKTPERFHTNRHGEPFRFTERVELRPTQPHTPQLMAVKRHRPVHALSREEQEKNEIEEMKKNQFKAHTIDEKVFKAPVLPAKKEMKMTKLEPFHLTEPHKKENIPPHEPIEQEFHFHAKPAPKFETQAVKERKPMPPTIPQTPKFSEAGKASLQNWRRQRSRSNGSVTNSLRSGSSNGSLNSCGTEQRLKNTVAEPFSFEIRDKKLQERKEKAIKKALEEERKQREFHANPCPNFSHPAMPERPTFSTTRPAPFQLSCETRGHAKKEKFLQQLEELRLEEKKAAQFKAQPAKILNREPFKIRHEQSKNNLTNVAEFNLSTEKRAVERKNFDQFLKEREQEKEAARLQRELEKIKQEEEALALEREKAIFHANPVRQYKAIEIKKAENELLTVPKTPKFMKKSC